MWHWLRLHTPPRLKVWFRHARSRVVDPRDRGIWVVMGGARVRVPAYFLGGGRFDYEASSIARFIQWLGQHPDALLVDVGCSLSIYGAVALSHTRNAEVIAIDADPVGLKCSSFLCSKVEAPDRLQLVHAVVGRTATTNSSLVNVRETTARLLASRAIPRIAEAIRYYDALAPSEIASLTLDQLLAGVAAPRPVLLKIDVEGTELDVLHGAAQTLRRVRPSLLLSVHPQFGVDISAVHEFLHASGYDAEHFATDHEEHWWCTPAA
jgi:FkbM family methyltransferase